MIKSNNGISGTINLEDIKIDYSQRTDGQIQAVIIDSFDDKVEVVLVSSEKFFKALAIAVHHDGMPDYKKDYEDAESIMGEIRWIP